MAGMTPDNGWLAFVLLARAAARSQWSFAMAAVATTFEDETIASSEEHDSRHRRRSPLRVGGFARPGLDTS